ncbi:MAG: class II glutamine amidotransferase, partial [Candidatus Heimdallarchaeota archaeon]
ILSGFAISCRESTEYHGHGWGIMMLTEGGWQTYKSINPIWKDDMKKIESFKLALVHARSAFRDEGIKIENNMPFEKNDWIFIFNGELRNVRIREQGRIGAEKLFNFILKFNKYGIKRAIETGNSIITKRSDSIRGMNYIIHHKETNTSYVNSYYEKNEAEYFSLNRAETDGTLLVSSEQFGNHNWTVLQNHNLEVIL